MKIKLAILAGLVILGGIGANIVNNFKNSPTGQVIEQLQEKKLAVKEYLETECTPKEGLKLPWQEKEYECPKQPTEK